MPNGIPRTFVVSQLRAQAGGKLETEQIEGRCGHLHGNAARDELLLDTFASDLVQLVDRDERVSLQRRWHAGGLEQRPQQLAVIEPDDEVVKAESLKHLADRGQDLHFDEQRRRPQRVDVALVELAEPAARRAIRTPHRLNLVALEESRQLVLVLRDDARERDRQIVPKRKIRFAGVLVLAALEDLEDQLVAFLAVLPQQRLNVLEGGRLERFEPVLLVHVADDTNHVFATAYLVWKEIACSARGFSRHYFMAWGPTPTP